MIGEVAGRCRIRAGYRSRVQLSDLPVGGVARLRGTSAAALASAAERRGPQDPVVVFPGLTLPLPSSPGAIIDDVLSRAVAVAFEVFPAWLPDPAIRDRKSVV